MTKPPPTLRAGQALVVVGAFSWLGANRDEWFDALGFGRWRQVEDWADAPRVVLEEGALLTLIDWGLPNQGARNAVTHFRESQVAGRTQIVIVLGHAAHPGEELALARLESVDVIQACSEKQAFLQSVFDAIERSTVRAKHRAALQDALDRLNRHAAFTEPELSALNTLVAERNRWVTERVLIPNTVLAEYLSGGTLDEEGKSQNPLSAVTRAKDALTQRNVRNPRGAPYSWSAVNRFFREAKQLDRIRKQFVDAERQLRLKKEEWIEQRIAASRRDGVAAETREEVEGAIEALIQRALNDFSPSVAGSLVRRGAKLRYRLKRGG
jgi:hypothetical protein